MWQWIAAVGIVIFADLLFVSLCKISAKLDKKVEELSEVNYERD